MTRSLIRALAMSLVAAVGAAWAADAPSSSPVPPKNLKKVGDHWTAWDPPPAGPDAYIIVKGDTLWDLAQEWLGDPFLWPQIWDENRYVLDSHWIYPGDPLVIPGRPTVVPAEGPPEVVEQPAVPAEDVTTADREPQAPEPPPPLLVADPVDVYCTGYIDPEHVASDVWIGGSEEPLKETLGEGDVVYLTAGRNQGIAPGQEFGIVREVRDVIHPTTGQVLGSYMKKLGRVRVMLVQDDTATGVIELSCEDVRMSDELVAWSTIPIPRRTGLPEFDRYDPTSSGLAQGEVVLLGDDRISVATGHVIHTDLGLASGVKPGDVLTVFREQTDLPRLMIGQAVVLTVHPTTSMAKLAYSVRESSVGDHVEVAEN